MKISLERLAFVRKAIRDPLRSLRKDAEWMGRDEFILRLEQLEVEIYKDVKRALNAKTGSK